jgi:cytochrome c oxidase subunit I
MASIAVPAHGHAAHGEHAMTAGEFVNTYVFSRDHKIIGLQFLFSTLLWFLVGGLLALGIRWQLAWPWSNMPVIGPMLFSAEGGQISPEFYTTLFTMHATVMIFFVIIPILAGAFGNYLIPLMIGADDMAFPTLNMLSYWFMWPAFICIGLSFLWPPYGAGAGWTSYPPLSAVPEAAPGSAWAQTMWLLQLHDDDHPDASTGHDDVPLAADDLGHVHHRHFAGIRPAGTYGGGPHAACRSTRWNRLLFAGRPRRERLSAG